MSVSVKIPRGQLVKLTGSEKQIAYAEDLREKAVRKREAEYEEAMRRHEQAGRPMPSQAQIDTALAQIVKSLNVHAEARWWIDHMRY